MKNNKVTKYKSKYTINYDHLKTMVHCFLYKSHYNQTNKNKAFNLNIQKIYLNKFILLSTILMFFAFTLLNPKDMHALSEEDYYACVGPPLAEYMNAICEAKGEFPKIKLLSPAYNVSSYTLAGIVGAMNDAGANWGCLDGIAGNLYNDHDTITNHINKIEGVFSGIGVSKPLFITETGWHNYFTGRVDKETAKEMLKNELNANSGRYSAGLLFNAFGTGYGWGRFVMSDEEIAFVCDGNCAKLGPNSATLYKQGDGFYARTQNNGMGYTLEIASSSGLQKTIDGINSSLANGATSIIRIGVSGRGEGFEDVNTYIDFLKSVNAGINGTAYALAGPNEPDLEPWLTPNCAGGPTSMCGFTKITMEPVTYRAQVIGIQTLDGNTPWRLKGRDLNNLAEKPSKIEDVFEIYVTSSDHVVQKPMVYRTLGNHNTIDEVLMRTPNYVPDTPAAIAFSIPYEAGIKIAGSFGKTARDSQKPGEKVSDFVKRLGWYQEETDEIGESPTMQAGPTKQNSSFRACIQKVGATTGFAFDVNGIIDITQPADRHSISVADNYVSSSLCSPGTNCENELYRFDINTGEIAYENKSENTLAQDEKYFIDQIAYQYQNQVQTNQIDSNKSSQDNSSLSSIINPTDVNAVTCAGANISILPQSSCLTGPCEVGYNLCAVPAGPPDHCNNHHIQITMSGSNGQSFYIVTTDETGFGHCYSPGMGSLQNFTGVDLIRDGPFTLTGKIWGGLLNDGVCNGPCSQEISVTCTLKIVNNKLESTCSQTPLPPPPPVNCLECSTWAGSACVKLIDPELPKSNECTSGLCKVTQDVTTMWSCLSACLPQPEPPDPPEPPGPEPRNPEEEPGPEPPDPPSCWQTIWNCIAGSEYMLMVAPKGFTGDYGNKTKDMTVNNNIVCIPGVNTGDIPAGVDDLCDEEPSKQNAKIEVKATAGNVTMIGETVKDTYVQFYDYTSQNERFCMRDSALTSPASSFPEDSQEMCDVFPLISSSTHSSGYPGASNPYGYGVGGGVNILYENNYFDPNLGAVTSIYDGGGRGRTNPLVDSLHVNYHWREFQNSPNSISDFRLNELKGWVTANADAGKKSIFEINWMSDRPNSGYEWGPDFTKESAYDPIVFSDGAKLLNYDNANVKQQVRYLINELGREFNDDPRIESVIIMDERRPVNSSESLVGVTVNGRPVSKRIDGYNVKWGDAYGTQWINWNKFLVDTYKQAFPNKILIANIAGGPAGVRAELVDYLVRNNVAIKNSGMVADFNNRQANPNNGLTLNIIDAQRFTMDRLLQMGEHGHMCEIPQPAWSDAWKHPPQALYWEILSLLSFGGDQLQYFSGTDSSNHMLNPNSTVVNNSIDFFKRYRNTTPSTTPSVWIALRGSEVGVEGNGATCPPTPFYPYNENYGWFMIQDDTPSDGKTKFWFSPWIPVIGIDTVNYDKYYRSTDSTVAVDGNGDPVSGKMYFKIAQGFYQSNGNNYTLKIRYKGMGTDTYKVVYRNSLGELVEKGPYTKVDNNEWFEEEVELDDVDFSPSVGFGGNSFYIDSNGDGEEFIGFVEVIPR